jgi:hypothetical protein
VQLNLIHQARGREISGVSTLYSENIDTTIQNVRAKPSYLVLIFIYLSDHYAILVQPGMPNQRTVNTCHYYRIRL